MAEIKENSPNKEESLPTQKFIEIEGVKNGVLILKNGGLRQVLLVSGINFDLKSEDEQGLIIGSFQNFLNSLNFTVQIFIHSRKLNIEKYLENLGAREIEESNALLKNQIVEYREFIKAFVSENAIMSKTYFFVVPYDPIKLSESGTIISDKIFGFLKKKGVSKPTERLPEQNLGPEAELNRHIEQLNQRVNQVITGLNQIDLRAVPLNDEETIELFYNLYNPQAIEKKGLEFSQ